MTFSAMSFAGFATMTGVIPSFSNGTTLVLPDLHMDLLCDLVFWYCIVRVIGTGTPGQAGSDDDWQDRDDRYRPVSDIVGM